ncbi:NUDIX hydrolase [Gordonia soli]|uniref:Nudix hydrolase domain-containing protein n=1 Tax=Gordonia soli NBRC 108243 TaxID=1223545 RepID=M0QIA0_9ACTN|nr:NUDIX domain-containing protein [Gordonia soli]GAC68273.1 hypothetical protein GS4_14_01040 [Gordonia soli NBRC 108243]
MDLGALLNRIVSRLRPHDELEQAHMEDVAAWIRSTGDLVRRERPATPPKHLVAYIVAIDPFDGSTLLGQHRKAGLWLPTGGHVEPGERPRDAAVREIVEELAIDPELASRCVAADPVFITVTSVDSVGAHVDVSLWYTIELNRGIEVTHDPSEFDSVRWWPVDEILAESATRFDRHFRRFLAKVDHAAS